MHERITAEICHEDKEAEARAKEMLEVLPEWNEVLDLMMEDKDVWPATEAAVKRKIDEVARGKEYDNHPEKHEHLPTVLWRRDSTLKIGMKLYRKKMNGRCQINIKGLHRWCFVADV